MTSFGEFEAASGLELVWVRFLAFSCDSSFCSLFEKGVVLSEMWNLLGLESYQNTQSNQRFLLLLKML